MKVLGKWALNVLIGIDQLFNAIFMGDPDETISSRIGKKRAKFGGKVPFWRHPLEALLDWILELIDEHHTIEAVEEDEGRDSLT